jgi:hypothetical protein
MHDLGHENKANSTRDNGIDRELPLPGVIDTIGFGFAALTLRPLAILPIVLLDLYLMLGPRVTLSPLSNSLAGMLRRRGDGWDDIATEAARLEGFNIFEVGSLEVPLLRTPGIVPSFAGDRIGDLRIGESWSSLPGGVVLLLLIGTLAVGFLLVAAYRSLLAQAALASRQQTLSVHPRQVVRRAGNIAAWTLALVGLAILVAMPVLVATIVAAVLGFGEVTLLWLFLLFPATWAWVHFFFSIHALVIDDAGPLEAMRSSYQVVQHHFWQSLRFMSASLLISTGLSFALRELATSLPGALLAILLNAVIASGMIVAAMLFYRDRANRLGLHAQVPGR